MEAANAIADVGDHEALATSTYRLFFYHTSRYVNTAFLTVDYYVTGITFFFFFRQDSQPGDTGAPDMARGYSVYNKVFGRSAGWNHASNAPLRQFYLRISLTTACVDQHLGESCINQ